MNASLKALTIMVKDHIKNVATLFDYESNCIAETPSNNHEASKRGTLEDLNNLIAKLNDFEKKTKPYMAILKKKQEAKAASNRRDECLRICYRSSSYQYYPH